MLIFKTKKTKKSESMENEQDELRHRHMQDQHPHQRVSIGYSDVMLHVGTREARKWKEKERK